MGTQTANENYSLIQSAKNKNSFGQNWPFKESANNG